MTDIALVLVTFADAAEAERIGRTIVEERLAACINIAAPCTSIYRWHGEVETASEVPATFKTTTILARRLVDRIAALHSYDLPVIEITPVATTPAVAQWVADSTG